MAHYTQARRMVRKGTVRWEQLERAGKVERYVPPSLDTWLLDGVERTTEVAPRSAASTQPASTVKEQPPPTATPSVLLSAPPNATPERPSKSYAEIKREVDIASTAHYRRHLEE